MRFTIFTFALAVLIFSSSLQAQCLSRFSSQDDLEEVSFNQLAGIDGIISTNIDFEEFPTGIVGPELAPMDYLIMKALPGSEDNDIGDNVAVICPGSGSRCLTAYPFFGQPEGLAGDNYPDSPALIISDGNPMEGNNKASFAGTIEIDFLNPVFAVSMHLGQHAHILPVKVEFFNISGELLDTQFVEGTCGYIGMNVDPTGNEPCWINKIIISPVIEAFHSSGCYSLDDLFFIHFDNSPIPINKASWGSLKTMYR